MDGYRAPCSELSASAAACPRGTWAQPAHARLPCWPCATAQRSGQSRPAIRPAGANRPAACRPALPGPAAGPRDTQDAALQGLDLLRGFVALDGEEDLAHLDAIAVLLQPLPRLPFSMFQPRRGITTSNGIAYLPAHSASRSRTAWHDRGRIGHHRRKERGAVGRRRKDAVEPLHRGIEVVKARSMTCAAISAGDPARREVLVHDQQAARLVQRREDGVDVQRRQRARVDHLGRDALPGKRLGRLQRPADHQRDARRS